MMRWDVVNGLLRHTTTKRYLEIGVQNGDCGSRVKACEKWGVDPAPGAGSDRHYHHLRKQASDDFFASLSDQRFGVVLVDGLHHADQVLRDVDNALKFLSDDGFVVMHDCNPQSEEAQKVPRTVRQWNGDCWKAVVRLRERADIDVFTIDSDFGIGVVRKGPNQSRVQDAPETLSYSDLVDHRDWYLRLVRPDWSEIRELLGVSEDKIHLVTAIAYDPDRNLGAAYNEIMDRLRPGDWCCFIDHDALWTTRIWYKQLLEAIETHSNVGLLTAVTNRVGQSAQVVKKAPAGHDLREHFAFGRQLADEHGVDVTDVTKGPLVSGVVLCLSKDTWEQIGKFSDGFLGVDNRAHQDVRRIGRRVLIMRGLYVYHWYRADGARHAGAPVARLS